MPASPRGGRRLPPPRGGSNADRGASDETVRSGGAADPGRLERAAGFAGALTGSVTALTLSVPAGTLSPVGRMLLSAYGSRH